MENNEYMSGKHNNAHKNISSKLNNNEAFYYVQLLYFDISDVSLWNISAIEYLKRRSGIK